MRSAAWLLVAVTAAFGREVAITIDDLPRGGDWGCEAAPLLAMTAKLLQPFRAGRIPVTGFVIGDRCPEVRAEALRLWLAAGAELGNHTYSHPNLNDTPASEYITDIVRGEDVVRKVTGVDPRYFRYPYLKAGKDPQTRQAVMDYLASHGRRNAPVTLDNSDYMFAAIYARALRDHDAAMAKRVAEAYVPYMESIFEFFERRSKEVTGHEIRQVLLIHASQLNADLMPELLAMMRRRGYTVVSLERALEDEAYGMAECYTGPGGFSWIHRWSMTAGMKFKGAEPDEPEWVTKAWNKKD